MSSETHLDNRLRLCADFVRRGSKAADIGTDHAYLPVWLCRHGFCPSAIAADINPAPLASGRLTIANAGLSDRIETRLSDGLREIDGSEADDIIIAGMGGELIAKILGDWTFSQDKTKHYILQPMTKSEALIAWLAENGFHIDRQDCCVAGGKCYTVLSVTYTGNTAAPGELFCYTGRLNPKNETHLRFLHGHIERLKKQAKGDAHFGVLAEQLEAFCDNG